jgi:hypothetical protein
MIFHYACASPFFPFVDEARQELSPSIIHNHDLFTDMSPRTRFYDESCSIFKPLRSVCRAWRVIIDDISDRYADRYIYTNLEGFTFPHSPSRNPGKVERMYLTDWIFRSYCFCLKANKCRGGCISANISVKEREEIWWNKDPASLQSMLRNVKIVFLLHDSPISERVLKATSGIRSLYLDFRHRNPALLTSSSMSHLTHLALMRVDCYQFFSSYFNGEFILPSVQYLQLTLDARGGRFAGDVTAFQANVLDTPSPFPNLQTLKISGSAEPMFKDTVLNFLTICGETVRAR